MMHLALQSFKVLLDAIANNEDAAGDKLRLLEGYLESTKPEGRDGEGVYLADIMRTWALAVQQNSDNVMSAAAVVLALLLGIISTRLHLIPTGVGIGRTILQPRQRDLLAKNLSADKGKEFVYSPTLRLVRVMLTLDGGTLASAVFRARSQTFAGLARNLGVRYLGDGVESAARPSARTNAVRFLLSALRFLHGGAKREILGQRELVAGITRFIKDDPPYLVTEILEGLKRDVLLDESLPRDAKGRLLSVATLHRIAALYSYSQDQGTANVEPDGGTLSVADLAHDFLLTACTNAACGVLRRQNGLYPRGLLDQAALSDGTAKSYADGQEPWAARFEDDVPVANTVLSEFIQPLRPWSSVKQSDLVVSIFRAAPELIAKYFLDKQTFSFEPKLSTTWIGYAAFLFAAIELPIPKYFGQESGYMALPPPTALVLDNIAPAPLNQKVLTRCFTIKSSLTSFIAARLLTLALGKLRDTVCQYSEAEEMVGGTAWREGRRELLHQAIQRLPSMKEIISAYRGAPPSDILHRATLSRLMKLYHDVIPQIALTSKFDVAPLVSKALAQLQSGDFHEEDLALSLVEARNMLATACASPSMRWFATSKELGKTPFAALLRLSTGGQQTRILDDDAAGILESLANEHQLVVPQKRGKPFTAYTTALLALQRQCEQGDLEAAYTLLGNAAAQCAASPLKYLDLLDDVLSAADSDPDRKGANELLDPLLAAINEQLPFVLKELDAVAAKQVYDYLLHLARLQGREEERRPALRIIFAEMEDRLPSALRGSLVRAIEEEPVAEPEATAMSAGVVEREADAVVLPSSTSGGTGSSTAHKAFEEVQSPPNTDLDNTALTRWVSRSIDELIDDGHVVALVRLLASDHQSIRREARTNLLKLAAKLKASDYDERAQVWLLLMEVAESAKETVATSPVPWTIVSFATHALGVLQDPLHLLYPKVNKFLLKGPTWMLDRLPIVQKILLDEPEGDDTWYREVSWLLQYLLDGLQTPTELKIFHDRRIYEHLCGMVSNPYMRADLKKQVFRILWRTTCVGGGSTTLVTRFGIVSWLKAFEATSSEQQQRALCAALLRRVWETCDQARVEEWSQGGITEAMLFG
jgi:nucleolar pre-ribosomal-associated protein 1